MLNQYVFGLKLCDFYRNGGMQFYSKKYWVFRIKFYEWNQIAPLELVCDLGKFL